MQFAQERLLAFENALAPAGEQKPTPPEELQDLLNNFIRAVDDTAEALEWALERGGVDLRKSRDPLAKNGDAFLQRLEHVRQAHEVSQGDLRYDLEDAVEATQDLLGLAKKIPDEFIPPKVPTYKAEGAPEREAPPGKPTLKRKKDEKPKPQ